MSNKKLKIIIQARMGSSRLPRKVMKKVCNKPLLELMLERLLHSKYEESIIVATTNKKQDDVICTLCNSLHIECFRGSENNVFDRYVKCAKEHGADIIVRLTADCPLIDIGILDDMIDTFSGSPYSNVHPRTFPDGMDIEIFTLQQLIHCKKDLDDKMREHVTTGLFRHNYMNYSSKTDRSQIRLTLDYEDDYKLIKEIYEALYVEGEIFTLTDILSYLGGES